MPATPQEITALLNELAESLKPAVLVLIDQIKPGVLDRDKNLPRYKYNAGILDKWLKENAVDKTTGEVAYTLKNLRKAVSVNKASLDWIVAPGSRAKSDVQTEGNKVFRREIPDIVSHTKRIQEKQAEEAKAEDQRTLDSVAGQIARHSPYPHSKAAKEKTELRAEFERLKKTGMKPADINKAIRKMIDGFPTYMGVVRR
jgi:hypothetical protein